MVRDLIFSPCGGIGGPLGPLVYEYYDEGFDNRKNPNVIGPPQSFAQWPRLQFFVLHILYFPDSSNKTDDIYDMFLNMFYKGEVT